MKKIDWIILAVITIFSIFILKDLYKSGFYTSHDGPHQVVRLYYFDQAVRDGQIPPRWVGGLLNGFGYPLFIFSYHFPWFIAESMLLLGLSIIDSIKMTFLIGFILSGFTMYFFQKEVFGRLAAISAVTVYLLAPYRFSNIFVRAAIGDATIFIFPPLLFLSVYKLKTTNNKVWMWISLAAVSIAGMLLSHAMVFLLFFLAYFMYFVWSFILSKKRILILRNYITSTFLGFCLAGYYFIPSFIERNFTKFESIMKSTFVGNTFLNLKELIYSPWGYGMMHAKEGGMSFQVGITQWIVVVLSGLLIIYYLVKKDKRNNKHITEAGFYLIIFILSIILMLPISLPFWKMISDFVIVDFTWRILPVTIFSTAVLAGFVISKIRFHVFIALFILLAALYTNRNHIRINKSLDWSIPFYLKLEKTTNSYDEYTPKWVGSEIVDKPPKNKIEFSSRKAEIRIIKESSNLLDFTINSDERGMVKVNTLYYPGWNATVNSQKTQINSDAGLINIPVDAGASHIILKFGETPLRLASDLVTLSAIFFLIYKIFKNYNK